MALVFRWNPGKAVTNVRKHGITFEKAATAFGDPLSLTIPDPDHGPTEKRFLLIGLSEPGRLLVVSHAERGDIVRVISARRATKRERTHYEEE
jgi:hypothetical protein